MKIQYFEDTDTLYITFSQKSPRETREIDQNTLLDLDAEGQLCGMTIEHAKDRIGIPEVQYEKISAQQF
ncbi:putative conserved small protein [Gloeomargarita lithophora Alchichica-D10]|uniref:Putative conserved small protein n=1 Tax=Gloeomargarita lithophora Alchichica-D10 TaxID=1188229 RepID=A0A1J0ADI2_9CYAN|nr:DUF2283 domain-containing protein [Gloeomargarita lithophora]APB33996.1 putative conserved small protein [Gloeomargarita lithophora Alchichica-D10]